MCILRAQYMKKTFFFTIWLSLFCTPAFATQLANEEAQEISPPQQNIASENSAQPFKQWTQQQQPTSYTSQLVISISFLTILCIIAFWLKKKVLPASNAKGSKNIKITETARLAPGKNLHVIELKNGQKILIGSTNNSINLLTYIDNDQISEAQ